MTMRNGMWVDPAELAAEEEQAKALAVTTGAPGYVAPPDVTQFEGIISPDGTVGTQPPPVDTQPTGIPDIMTGTDTQVTTEGPPSEVGDVGGFYGTKPITETDTGQSYSLQTPQQAGQAAADFISNINLGNIPGYGGTTGPSDEDRLQTALNTYMQMAAEQYQDPAFTTVEEIKEYFPPGFTTDQLIGRVGSLTNQLPGAAQEEQQLTREGAAFRRTQEAQAKQDSIDAELQHLSREQMTGTMLNFKLHGEM